ncbi:MAG: hypothetical protein ACNS62_17125 [Candidatus Cyclobacteriaceae bacterium M3_2C_046]
MIFSFTFDEIADLANFYVVKEQTNEKLDFEIFPLEDGIKVSVYKMKVSFLNIKSRVYLRFKSFDGEELVLSVHFKNIFVDLAKKIVFVLILNLLKNKLKVQDNGTDISHYIKFTTSSVHIDINKIFTVLSVPMRLNSLKKYAHRLEIDFTVKKLEKPLKKQDKIEQIAENAQP